MSTNTAVLNDFDFSHVPQKLKALSNWVVWKFEERDGKTTKPPYIAASGTARLAKGNDPATWRNFKEAVDAADILSGNAFDGIGFEFKNSPYIGIEFDDVRTEDGTVEPFVLAILGLLKDTYVEISPSGHGLHAYIECSNIPPKEKGRKFTRDHYGAELYSGPDGETRYFTVTGNKFSGNDEIAQIDNLSLVHLLCSQILNDKFKALWLGDMSKYGNDQSRADLALLNLLGRLTDQDAAKMEEYFSQSQLGQRDKWQNRDDYRKRSIEAALSGKKGIAGEDESNQEQQELLDRANFIDIDDIEMEHLEWLWPWRVPLGALTLFAGHPDNGKSISATSVIAHATTGRKWIDAENETPPCHVIVLVGEEGLKTTFKPRLVAAGADVLNHRIHCLESVSTCRARTAKKRQFNFDTDLSALKTALDQYPETKLLVVDPISNYLGETSMNAEQEIRSILIPLKELAEERKIAIVLVMHLNKKNDLDAISRVGGAMAFVGVSRCAWLFTRDQKEPDSENRDQTFSMLRIKNNLAPTTVGGLQFKIETSPVEIQGKTDHIPYVIWTGTTDKNANDLLHGEPKKAGRPPQKLEAAKAWLCDFLKAGPRTASEVFEYGNHDFSEKTLRRAKEELGIEAFQDGGKWLWKLPESDTMDFEPASPSDLIEVDDVRHGHSIRCPEVQNHRSVGILDF